MQLNKTINKSLEDLNPVVANEKSIAILGYPALKDTYRPGAMVFSDVVAAPSKWSLVKDTTTNDDLIPANIKVGVISCIHDACGCSYDEIDVDNSIHLLDGDVNFSIVQHSTEAHLFQKKLKIWDSVAGEFIDVVQADYLAGGVFEGILEVVDASTDGDKPVLKFKD